VVNEFEEKQRFRQWWIWVVLMLPLVSSAAGLIFAFQSAEGISADVYCAITIILILNGVFLVFRLDTCISAHGISARMIPIHLKFKTYYWDELDSIEVRRYNPIREFGGWGFRSHGGKKGNAWNISGNYGIQLKFKSGRELLIGTQKPEEVEFYLRELSSLNPQLNIPLIAGKTKLI